MSEFATVELMCAARETRRRRQEELLTSFPGTLVCFSMNIAGPYKRPRFSRAAMDAGEDALFLALPHAKLLHWEEVSSAAGHERFYCFAENAAFVKRAACAVEDTHPLGRLFDLDVLEQDGRKLSRGEFGMSPRKCLLCDEEASVCARSRRHSLAELQAHTEKLLCEYFLGKASEWLCERADAALGFEVSVTPKPGLVDRNNNGAHCDMTYGHFERSIEALSSYWPRFVEAGWEHVGEASALLLKLRPIGREAEEAMLLATEGVNTHKGAIFSFGILLAAAGHLMAEDRDFSVEELLAYAGEIAKPTLAELHCVTVPVTHGEAVYRSHGSLGARGEAAAGFPHALEAKTAFDGYLKRGLNENDAGALTLITLLARLQDTNLISRVGETAHTLQKEAEALLQLPSKEALSKIPALDERFISLNASPGGCADLLALGWLLHRIFEE